MTFPPNQRVRLDRLEEGEWLNRMLMDIQVEIAGQPSPRAVERIRTRLLRHISAPTRAAA